MLQLEALVYWWQRQCAVDGCTWSFMIFLIISWFSWEISQMNIRSSSIFWKLRPRGRICNVKCLTASATLELWSACPRRCRLGSHDGSMVLIYIYIWMPIYIYAKHDWGILMGYKGIHGAPYMAAPYGSYGDACDHFTQRHAVAKNIYNTYLITVSFFPPELWQCIAMHSIRWFLLVRAFPVWNSFLFCNVNPGFC